MAKLTTRDVDALSVSGAGNSAMLWDGELKGFGIRAFPSGTKKFIVQYRTRAGRQRRMTLGAYGPLTVERARDHVAITPESLRAQGLFPIPTARLFREILRSRGN
ncbi:Arm DNA-binding domain-containing protein [Sphingosinicella sp.]|uniref:Arm DNA-binding domain-containing protein n=1 Tax=Sphingosinicella sp. TaxID=1917971 RepID=UPI00403782D8